MRYLIWCLIHWKKPEWLYAWRVLTKHNYWMIKYFMIRTSKRLNSYSKHVIKSYLLTYLPKSFIKVI
jgi:hypothetical protein